VTSTRELELERAEAVRVALSAVQDPELGLDIVSLGLVYEVDVVGTRARVTYTLTSMGCPVAPQIEHDITMAALTVDGIERVDPELVFSPAWSPDRMNEDAKFVLGFGV
jgi:metal-sulfur cluster biosynthetic enzyme